MLSFDVAPIKLGTPSENLLYTNSEIVFEKSLLNRPEIESAKLAIESADLSIEIAKSAYKPTLTYSLSAGTSYYHQFNNLLPTRFNDDFISQTADRFQYGIGFNVSVPIFNRFQTKNNVAKSTDQQRYLYYTIRKRKDPVKTNHRTSIFRCKGRS